MGRRWQIGRLELFAHYIDNEKLAHIIANEKANGEYLIGMLMNFLIIFHFLLAWRIGNIYDSSSSSNENSEEALIDDDIEMRESSAVGSTNVPNKDRSSPSSIPLVSAVQSVQINISESIDFGESFEIDASAPLKEVLHTSDCTEFEETFVMNYDRETLNLDDTIVDGWSQISIDDTEQFLEEPSRHGILADTLRCIEDVALVAGNEAFDQPSCFKNNHNNHPLSSNTSCESIYYRDIGMSKYLIDSD